MSPTTTTLRLAGAAAVAMALHCPPAQAQTATAPTTPAAKADLPKADTIIEKAVDSMGGRKSFDAIRSAHVKATMTADTPGGPMTFEMDMYVARPDLYLKKTTSSMMGEISEGHDGEVAWMDNPMMGGIQIIDDPEQIQSAYRQAAIYNIVSSLHDEYPTMETVDKARFADTDCYKMRLVDADGNEAFAYFDVDSGRIVGHEQTEQTSMGEMKSEIVFGDWKKVDDLTLYHSMNVKQGPMTLSMTINEISFNGVDKKMFAAPEDVKKLVKAKAATRPSTAPDDGQ